MPPGTGDIEKKRRLPDNDRELVASFFGSDAFADAIRASRFDLHEETTLLVNAMRSPEERTALAAQRQFRSLLRDVAETNGVIVNTSVQKKDQDGSTATVSGSRIAARIREANEGTGTTDPDFAARRLLPDSREPVPPPVEGGCDGNRPVDGNSDLGDGPGQAPPDGGR